ncbi:hypothetical protein [Aureimonas frigidaquae]|uniref:hypothetical protein n=1 Tax=Aureimonas frigidaquae TaxID=424757 RepID=UPI0007865D43|nr:hypothetical protein [Aureimonas frigidaquae]
MSEAQEPSEIAYSVGSHFQEPGEVIDDTHLSRGEKRQLLEDWRFRLDARVARRGSSELVRRRQMSLAKALETLEHTQH